MNYSLHDASPSFDAFWNFTFFRALIRESAVNYNRTSTNYRNATNRTALCTVRPTVYNRAQLCTLLHYDKEMIA